MSKKRNNVVFDQYEKQILAMMTKHTFSIVIRGLFSITFMAHTIN